MSRRRGETLVEVVVSFAIMSFVLLGVSGLVTQLVAMISESRTETQATTLAQQGLVNGVAFMTSSCDIRDEDELGFTFPFKINDVSISRDPTTGIELNVYLDELLATEQTTSPALPAALALTNANGFRKVVSTVDWYDKLGQLRSYTLTQVIRR